MTSRVNPEMIVLARDARGVTQAELADVLCLNQATVSRYESGAIEAPPEHVAKMAAFLRRPVEFFYWDEKLYRASCLYHRKKARISANELRIVHAQVNIMRIQASRLLKSAEIKSNYRFHRLDPARFEGGEGCAKTLRQLWQLPMGPIRNVVRCIESAGGIVFRCPFGAAKVDGISQWPLDAPALPPVFFVNEKAPGDRERWTLCHEIGHIVMHHMPSTGPEMDANLFASEFLMPAKEIVPELSDMTLQKAAALKAYWKTSMQSIIYRAKQLGKISTGRYEYLFRQMTALGYRKCEPLPMPPEEPQLLREIIQVHRNSHRRRVHDLSILMGMPEDEFRDTYWQSLSGLRLAI
jgi:Zn-dependent peptidase ImmA (M78 family)/transcriptional regulator with XRE-family HTH domain